LLSPVDMIVIGAAALMLFGPDQLPRVARKVGSVVHDLQMTSQTFIREMERAADDADLSADARRGTIEEAMSEYAPVEHIADPTPAPGAPHPEPDVEQRLPGV
jgi:Sec-independent protein translocase protein TatA